jgi:hypothetical protein
MAMAGKTRQAHETFLYVRGEQKLASTNQFLFDCTLHVFRIGATVADYDMKSR